MRACRLGPRERTWKHQEIAGGVVTGRKREAGGLPPPFRHAAKRAKRVGGTPDLSLLFISRHDMSNSVSTGTTGGAGTKGFNTENTEKGHRDYGELVGDARFSLGFFVCSVLWIFWLFTPSRCGRACGTGWPRRDGASRGFPTRPGRQWCARLSGCGRGRARKARGGRSRFQAFFRLPR
jgi:hypothetical protein